MTRRDRPFRTVHPAMLMLGMMALWSVVVGGTVVRTHHHALAPAGLAAAATPVVEGTDPPCPLCQATAWLDPYLPPPPALPAISPGQASIVTATAGQDASSGSVAHHWNSRAPPIAVAAT